MYLGCLSIQKFCCISHSGHINLPALPGGKTLLLADNLLSSMFVRSTLSVSRGIHSQLFLILKDNEELKLYIWIQIRLTEKSERK